MTGWLILICAAVRRLIATSYKVVSAGELSPGEGGHMRNLSLQQGQANKLKVGKTQRACGVEQRKRINKAPQHHNCLS